jgi:hypothetical protein
VDNFLSNNKQKQLSPSSSKMQHKYVISINGGIFMYVGRDMTALSMIPKSEWKDSEIAFFHHSFQQIAPYLNAEGQSLHREIIEEIEARGGMKRGEADYTHGTRVSFD